MVTALWLTLVVLAGGVGVWFGRRLARATELAAESPLLARARVLTAEAETLDASGEYKRHMVYARLLKEYPAARKRDVAKAIEAVL